MIQNTRIDRQERGLMRANMETGGIPVAEERERHSAPGKLMFLWCQQLL